MRPPLPDKLFFKIGEVASLVGVKAHVLRYWESEFQSLRPMKTRGAHRVYKRRDVELAVLIRRLLHDEGYTIPGAKKRLRELGHEKPTATTEASGPARELALRGELLACQRELRTLLSSLDAVARRETAVPTPAVTVLASTPTADVTPRAVPATRGVPQLTHRSR